MTPMSGMRSARGLLAGLAAITACLAATSAHAESFGCTNVNLGFYNSTYTNMNGRQIPNFAIGDQLSITVSSISAGTFTLKNSTSVTRLSWTTPGTQTYTVADASDAANLLLANDTSPSSTVVSASSCNSSPGPSGDRSEAVTRGFLQSRINGILLNNPGATSLINRSQTIGPQQVASAGNASTNVASNTAAAFGSAMGLGASLGDATGRGMGSADDASLGSRNIQFRSSLSQLRHEAAQRRADQDRMALGAGDGGSVPIIYDAYTPWDVWVEGRFSAYNDDQARLNRDGHVGVLYLGGDYRITPDMIIGGLVQFDWAKDESGVLSSDVDGHGWMVGPYLSARVHENIYFDLRAAWGRSNNDIDVAGASGSFDTTRWLVRGALAGNWYHDAWRITPSAELAYIKESAESYTNSAGTFVAAQDVALGRLQFGPEVGYRFVHTADSFIEPFAAIRGVWDFDNPNVEIINGYIVGPGDFWGRLEGGLNWVTSSGLYVRGSATWDGMGASDYNGYTLQGTVNVPLN